MLIAMNARDSAINAAAIIENPVSVNCGHRVLLKQERRISTVCSFSAK